MPKATYLECSLCATRREAGQIANLCSCGGPLLVRYDLDAIRPRWKRREVSNGPASMWRYAPVLPVSKPAAAPAHGTGPAATPASKADSSGPVRHGPTLF